MTALLVADSFLVDDGRVRGLELHRARFAGSCAALGVPVDAFWDEALADLPREGRWFPRLELTIGRRLTVRLRPAPPPGDEVRVRVYDGADPRREPRVKGPDLELLGALREQVSYGADEVLLCAPGGTVLEAAYASLVWWEGDVLCLPPQDLPVLPSVTVALLRRIAADRGTEVAERSRSAAELDRREAWLVNALHGIRPVRRWEEPIGSAGSRAIRAGAARRAGGWQRSLRRLAVPL
jgi:branched-subunit amino acid aminotransferase/4-amino-4-deoxychorismate lyase